MNKSRKELNEAQLCTQYEVYMTLKKRAKRMTEYVYRQQKKNRKIQRRRQGVCK